MQKILVGAAALALFLCHSSGQASASAGFDCVIEDAHIALAASGHGPRGIPSGILGFGGQLTVKWPWMPDDFRSLALEGKLVQSWWADGDLKLLIYQERMGDGAFASLEIMIDTKISEDEITYAGSYRLHFVSHDPKLEKNETVTGRVACGGE